MVIGLATACASVGSPVERAQDRIAALEDARTDGGGELAGYLASENPEVRERCCEALGRLPRVESDPEVTARLLGALADPAPSVRAAAAFALGVRGDASAADKLLFVALDHHDADSEPLVRARAIEAASKLDRPELRERMLEGLRDADSRVRLETAQGTSRWPATEASAKVVNQTLVDALATEKERDVVVYTLFALERRKAVEAMNVFARQSTAEDADVRLFAVRGLKSLAATPGVLGDLWRASVDSDARIAGEAVLGLGATNDFRTLGYLVRAAQHSSPHVRRCAWDAIGAYCRRIDSRERALNAKDALAPLWTWSDAPARLEAEPSLATRAAMLEAMLPADEHFAIVAPEPPKQGAVEAVSAMALRGLSASPIVLAGAARGVGASKLADAAAILIDLGTSGELLVRESAIEALAKHPGAESRRFLHACLGDADNGIRLSAVLALQEMPDASDLEPLERCMASARGDGAAEIRFNALRNASKIGSAAAEALLTRGGNDPSRFVRSVARDELAKLGRSIPARAHEPQPSPELDVPRPTRNPWAEVVTTKGSLVFELFPRETPVHVASFLALAERDHYDGTLWHRVVPDFVIQGGDYRGDGNGGGTWKGRDQSLRHEITPRKYVRGSLGMPRNDDVDSGGSQIFVTHRPTPHLDGRYTIFGELREGFEVLDAIEIGDRILDVRRIER
jgi:cyclophilin family peptidyl-prolyl cis-trans isomerase